MTGLVMSETVIGRVMSELKAFMDYIFIFVSAAWEGTYFRLIRMYMASYNI